MYWIKDSKNSKIDNSRHAYIVPMNECFVNVSKLSVYELNQDDFIKES